MSKPLKEDYIIRIKSRIEQRLDEPAAEEEKEEFVELMTRGSFVLKGGSYYVTYRETETTGYEGCTTTLKIAADGSRVAMLRFGKGGGAGTQLLIEKGRRNLCPVSYTHLEEPPLTHDVITVAGRPRGALCTTRGNHGACPPP